MGRHHSEGLRGRDHGVIQGVVVAAARGGGGRGPYPCGPHCGVFPMLRPPGK